jgi:hypothetical protein
MTTAADAAAQQTFIVVATMRDDANFAELAALRADEEKQLEVLHSLGRLGSHHVAPARGTVFLEVIAADEEHVAEVLATLPFHRFFEADVYPISDPAVANAALQADA